MEFKPVMERDAEFRGSEWDQPSPPIDYNKVNEPHDEQVDVWADDVAEALLPWLKEFDDCADKIAFFEALKHQLRGIAEEAHTAGMRRAKQK